MARPPFLVWAFNLALIMLSFYLCGRSEPPCTENLDFGYVAKWKGCDFSDAPCHGYVLSEALVSLFPSSLAIDEDQCYGWIMDNCYDVHVSNNVSSRLCEDNGYMPDWAVRSTLAFHSGLDSFRTWVSGLVPEDSVLADWAAYIIGGSFVYLVRLFVKITVAFTTLEKTCARFAWRVLTTFSSRIVGLIKIIVHRAAMVDLLTPVTTTAFTVITAQNGTYSPALHGIEQCVATSSSCTTSSTGQCTSP